MAGLSYYNAKYRFISHYKDGKWDEGELSTDNILHINESSTALHYGQQCFEGLKAYRTKNGDIQLFRPEMNAKRFQKSCRDLLIPIIEEDVFVDAVVKTVRANEELVPEYGKGETLYIRTLAIGVGENLGVKEAPEYIFLIFVCPAGAYFSDGLKPIDLVTTEYDRAAPNGTGQIKCGGNYGASLKAHREAKEKGYADCIYLDPATHTKIEEVGAANFFGITHDNKFITPKSNSILESITKLSLLDVARDLMKMEVLETDVFIDDLEIFKEAGACGTAAAITPIGSITHNGKKTTFTESDEAGEVVSKLYDLLTGIQFGEEEDVFNWTLKLND